jgi:hypothetical protein
VFTFKCYRTDATTSQPTHQAPLIVDKRKTHKVNNYIAYEKLALTKDSLKKRGSNLSDAARKPTGQQDRVLEKRATPKIPKEYKEFKHLFQEVVDADALPKHQP